MKFKKIVYFNIIIIGIVFLVSLVGNGSIMHNDDNVILLNNEWTYSTLEAEDENSILVPVDKDKISDDDVVVIERNLPEITFDNPCILFRSEMQTIKVYLDDELIYSLTKNENQKWGKEPESTWVFVDLPEGYEGEDIKVEYSSKYRRYNIIVNTITIGSKSDLLMNIFTRYGGKLVAAVILTAIGVMLIVIYFGLIKSKNKYIKFLYLALLDILSGIWIAFDSHILDLFLSENFPKGEVKLISMFIIPIIFVEFFKVVCKGRKYKILDIIESSFISFLVISSILHFCNIVSYVETISIFHAMCVVSMLIAISIIIKEFNNILEYGQMLVGAIILLIISAILDIRNYYSHLLLKGDMFYLEYTIIIFSLVFSYYVGEEFFKLYNEEVKNDVYKELAYTDPLTRLFNKAAFDEKMNLMNMDIEKFIGVPIFMFDINNLKKLNDIFGHSNGNEYIKENAMILKEIFGEHGALYRISGDKFTFIGSEKTPISECIEKLSDYVEVALPDHKINCIGISYGYEVIHKGCESVFEVESAADRNMRKLKNRLKNSNIR